MFRSVAGEVCSGRPIRAVYLGSSLSSLLPSAAMNGGANVINPSSKNQHHAGAGVADPSLSYDQAPPHAPALPQFVTVKALNHRNGHRRQWNLYVVECLGHHDALLSWSSMRSPIHLTTGTAQELPNALYLFPSAAGLPR